MKYLYKQHSGKGDFSLRRRLLLGFMLLGMLVLMGRAIFLHVIDIEFLKQQADRRHVSVVSVPAYRGKIVDRNNEPLAISTPMESVWVNPSHFKVDKKKQLLQVPQLLQLVKLLGIPEKRMRRLMKKGSRIRFAYLKRRVNPKLANKVKQLEIKGVYFAREFKRYYPTGAVSAHIVGFTDIDDVGQEGMERGYEDSLKGIAGKKRVIRDGRRRAISDKDIENIKESIAGQDLMLSIDQRVQYLAFKALKTGVAKHKAVSASVVILDAKTGEVLGAVSQPAFNPNTRKNLKGRLYRNRTMLDTFEPGSTMKPFVIAGALDGGYVDRFTRIETHGLYRIGRNLVRDGHNYGTLDLMHILKKSSNIGASKVALRMPAKAFWDVYNSLGFGMLTHVGFPAEESGSLSSFRSWNQFGQAALSYGYGVSVTTLQLARAYTALADGGMLHSVSLLKRNHDYDAQRVFSEKTANKVLRMLEHVIKKDGTAYQARVEGYRVAGKTGTTKKAVRGGYASNRYLAIFVGIAPVSDPRFVIAVVVDDPRAGKYYGGLVAAPIFAEIMAGILRLYGVAPDKEESMPILLTAE